MKVCQGFFLPVEVTNESTTATIGYTLPSSLTQWTKIENTRLYCSLSDILTMSQYPDGWDPEIVKASYPMTYSVIFGLSVNF